MADDRDSQNSGWDTELFGWDDHLVYILHEEQDYTSEGLEKALFHTTPKNYKKEDLSNTKKNQADYLLVELKKALSEEKSFGDNIDAIKISNVEEAVSSDDIKEIKRLLLEDYKVLEAQGGKYKFPFVGLLEIPVKYTLKYTVEYDDKTQPLCGEKEISQKRLVFVEPKFFTIPNGEENSPPPQTTRDKLQPYHTILLQAILKYHKEDSSPFSGGLSEQSTMVSSRLDRWLMLVQDWMEHGTYLVEQTELEENGDGEINWEETIARKQPYWQKTRSPQRQHPIYMEYFTESRQEDPSHYVTRLHQCLLAKCFHELEELGLAKALGLFCDAYYEGELSEFGEKDYILSRLKGELGNQFITAKRHTLELMKGVIEDEFGTDDDLGPQMLGMKNVHSLWEKAIKEVFGDQLDMKISDIKGLTPEDSKKDKTLMEYIDPPKWMGKTGQDGALEITKKGKVGQLEPDFVAIEKYENSEQKYMVILDAKYYVPDFSKDGKTITGQPGVGDINKQFLYQLAYKHLIERNNLKVFNAFVFPEDDHRQFDGEYKQTQGNAQKDAIEVKYFATVNVPMFDELFKDYGDNYQPNLRTYKIGGIKLLDMYAKGQKGSACLREILKAVFPPKST